MDLSIGNLLLSKSRNNATTFVKQFAIIDLKTWLKTQRYRWIRFDVKLMVQVLDKCDRLILPIQTYLFIFVRHRLQIKENRLSNFVCYQFFCWLENAFIDHKKEKTLVDFFQTTKRVKKEFTWLASRYAPHWASNTYVCHNEHETLNCNALHNEFFLSYCGPQEPNNKIGYQKTHQTSEWN